MKLMYLESIVLVEKLYRLFLDFLKNELKKLGVIDINNVQTLILYNIGKDKITVGELVNRGYYMGSNVSYNLKKLVQSGYVDQKRSDFDKRSSFVYLTTKGLDLFDKLDTLLTQQSKLLTKSGLNDQKMQQISENLRILEENLTRYH